MVSCYLTRCSFSSFPFLAPAIPSLYASPRSNAPAEPSRFIVASRTALQDPPHSLLREWDGKPDLLRIGGRGARVCYFDLSPN